MRSSPSPSEWSPSRAVPTWRRLPTEPDQWFSADELARSRRYQRPLARLRVGRALLFLGVAGAFSFGGLGEWVVEEVTGAGWFPEWADGWIGQLIVMILALEAATLLYDPALDAWVDLVHDRRWGVSTQTARGLAADQAKSIVLTTALEIVLLVPLYALIRATGLWWLWGWGLAVVASVVLSLVFPVVVAPIFNRFTPLADHVLAARIDQVAEQAGVSIGTTLVADESRRSTRDNAYVAGLGPTRRVVLYDTILGQPVEVVAQVIAHEIGHWRRHHLRTQIPVSAAAMLVVFIGLGLLGTWTWLFEQAGASGVGDPVGLPILVVAAQVGVALTGLATSWVSRAHERQADLDALDLLGEPDVMVDMLRRLHVENLADLDPGSLRYLRLSHPPAAERMLFTRRWAERQMAAAG